MFIGRVDDPEFRVFRTTIGIRARGYAFLLRDEDASGDRMTTGGLISDYGMIDKLRAVEEIRHVRSQRISPSVMDVIRGKIDCCSDGLFTS